MGQQVVATSAVSSICLLCAAFCPAQSSSTPALSRRGAVVHAVPDDKMVLDVNVESASGSQPTPLSGVNFKVIDDGNAVSSPEFSSARESQTPIRIIFVLDTLQLGITELNRVKDQVEQFLKKANGTLGHPTSIVLLLDSAGQKRIEDNSRLEKSLGSGALVRLIPSSRNGSELANALEHSPVYASGMRDAQGSQGEADREQFSMRALDLIADAQSHIPGRKLVIWISAAGSGNSAFTSQSQKQLLQTLVYMQTALARARITLYDIDPLGIATGFMFTSRAMGSMDLPPTLSLATQAAKSSSILPQQKEQPLAPSRVPQKVTPDQLSLASLAMQSGGLVLGSSNDMETEIERCVHDAENWYTFAYTPAPAKKANEYRSLKVQLSNTDAIARTRTGYFWQPNP